MLTGAEGEKVDGPRPGASRREMLVGGALVLAAGVAFLRAPRPTADLLGKTQLDELMPERIGDWTYQTSSGLILPPADQLRDKIYSHLLTRIYQRADGAEVMLLIAYSGKQDGTVQVHRPEVCYPASGYRLVSSVPHAITLPDQRTLPARYVITEGQVRNEELVYWTRIGPHFPTTWGQEHLDGTDAVLDVTLGRGKLFMMGPEVNQRGQSWATFKLLFNGILYGPAVSAKN